MNRELITVPRTLSPRACAASLLNLALELNQSPAGFIAARSGEAYELLACRELDEETILETKEIKALLEPSTDTRWRWTLINAQPLLGAPGQVSICCIHLDREPFHGLLVLVANAQRRGELAPVTQRLTSSWAEQLAAVTLLRQRTHDRDTGLFCRQEIEPVILARESASLFLVELRGRRLSQLDLARCGRLLRRSFPPGVPIFSYSRAVFAAVLDSQEREELRQCKDTISTAFLKVPVFKDLNVFFGVAIKEKRGKASALMLMAAGALAEAVASGSPELIIRPNRYSRRSRSTGSLRRGTGRMARTRPTVDAFYILKAAASEGDECLRFVLETLLSNLSMTRESFLESLILRLCHWLEADCGAVYRGARGAALKFDLALSERGDPLVHSPGIDERLLRVVQISGRSEYLANDDDGWILALPLRDGSQDLALAFKFPPQQARLSFEPALLTSILLGIESALELFRLRDRSDRDRQEIKDLGERIETLEKSQTGELVPVKAKGPLLSGRYDKIVGRSAAMGRVLRILDRVTDSDVPILIQGETGTGKELVARCLHENGPRCKSPFTTINCSAISESLMESELFGHVRGAFTGATEDKEGYFERAHEGSLFLDEVQDMSPTMQRELLRVLEGGEVQRVGGKRIIKVDVRIVAATNQDLKTLVSQGQFRQDLYYRLNVVIVDLPPLRRRREDLPELVDHFLIQLAQRYSLTALRLEQDALQLLLEHDWIGNIRELQNLLEKTILMLDGHVIRSRDIRFEGTGELRPRPLESYFDQPYKNAKETFLKEYLKASLSRHGGHVTKAAKDAGIVRSSFHKMMRKHKISTQDFLPLRR
jgi:two-component system, NtrC family, nitrogen regulation response regulator NtrX